MLVCRYVLDTTLPDIEFNRIIHYWILHSCKLSFWGKKLTRGDFNTFQDNSYVCDIYLSEIETKLADRIILKFE